MSTFYRSAMPVLMRPVLKQRYYHGTAVVYKYSYLNDMTKLRNPFDESSFNKIFKWFTDSPNIDVDKVEDTHIWQNIGGQNSDASDKKQIPQEDRDM